MPFQTRMSTAREPAAAPSATVEITAVATWSAFASLAAGIIVGQVLAWPTEPLIVSPPSTSSSWPVT